MNERIRECAADLLREAPGTLGERLATDRLREALGFDKVVYAVTKHCLPGASRANYDGAFRAAHIALTT